MVDCFRFVVIIVAIVAASQLPGILTARIPGWRSWVILAAVEILLLSKVAGMLSRLGEPIRWWGSPATLVASALILVYVASALPKRTRRTRV